MESELAYESAGLIRASRGGQAAYTHREGPYFRARSRQRADQTRPPSAVRTFFTTPANGYRAVGGSKNAGTLRSKAKCPAHEKNKQAHAAFLGVFGKFKERYDKEGPKPDLLRSLQTAAASWIKEHILSVDIQLKACSK